MQTVSTTQKVATKYNLNRPISSKQSSPRFFCITFMSIQMNRKKNNDFELIQSMRFKDSLILRL